MLKRNKLKLFDVEIGKIKMSSDIQILTQRKRKLMKELLFLEHRDHKALKVMQCWGYEEHKGLPLILNKWLRNIESKYIEPKVVLYQSYFAFMNSYFLKFLISYFHILFILGMIATFRLMKSFFHWRGR